MNEYLHLALIVLEDAKWTEDRLLALTGTGRQNGGRVKRKTKTTGKVWKAMVNRGSARRLGREWIGMMKDTC